MSLVWVAAVAVGLSVWWWWPVRRSLGAMARPDGSRSAALWLGLPRWLVGPRPVTWRVRVLSAAGAAGCVLVMLGGTVGTVVAIAAGMGVAIGVAHLPDQAHRRRQLQLAKELPTAVELLAAMVAAGAPLRRAAAEVAAVSPPQTGEVLAMVVAHTDVGVSDERAWRLLAERGDWSGGWAAIGRDLARSAGTGAGVSSVLVTHAREARRRRQEQLEAAAKAVGVRSVVPLMACFLPAFVAVGVVPIIAGTILRALG